MVMRKSERQKLIVNLVSSRRIGSQEELSRLLSEYGYSVTQASVSRDLEELRIGKINGHYEVSFQNGAARPEFGRVTFATAGENLIVVKCGSGLASAAAVRIDAAAISHIVGTIAGDDTIFIAVGGAKEQTRVMHSLKNILETSEGNGNY
jgi:transcriptional regulator of arginine metabolism